MLQPQQHVVETNANERTSEPAARRFGLRLIPRSTTVTMSDGARYNLKGGLAWVLSWWPLPVVGCYSTGSSPHGDTRECGADFHRSIVQLVFVDEGIRGDDVALAAALGLRRVEPDHHKASTSTELMRTQVAAAQQRVFALEVSELDRAIADPAAAISFVLFENLLGRLDIIQPRLGPIVAAIEQGIQLGGKARHNAQQLFRLLETVPRMRLLPIWTASKPYTSRTVRLC
jgi:hypothetical protein